MTLRFVQQLTYKLKGLFIYLLIHKVYSGYDYNKLCYKNQRFLWKNDSRIIYSGICSHYLIQTTMLKYRQISTTLHGTFCLNFKYNIWKRKYFLWPCSASVDVFISVIHPVSLALDLNEYKIDSNFFFFFPAQQCVMQKKVFNTRILKTCCINTH